MAVANRQALSCWGRPGDTWQRTNEVSADRMGGVPGGRTAAFAFSGPVNCKVRIGITGASPSHAERKPNNDM